METFYNKLGLSTQPQQGAVFVGVNDKGEKLYGDPALSNDTNLTTVPKVISDFQSNLQSIGANTKEDDEHLNTLNKAVQDPTLFSRLDKARGSSDPKMFNKVVASFKRGVTEEEINAAYSSWGVLSPTQKQAAVMHLGADDKTYYDRDYLPGVNTRTALDLNKQGIPMKNVKGNWSQIEALHTSIGHEGDSVSAIKRAARSQMIGPAQKMDGQIMSYSKATPAPQYGIGALELPVTSVIPKGYSVAGKTGINQVIVPQGNEASVVYNPKYNASAGAIYATWPDAGKGQALNGSTGGSNMYKTLTTLYDTNPKALGTALDKQIPGEGLLPDKSNGLALQVLTKGKIDGAKPVSKDLLLKEYGKAGIQNKDIGYKLANQAYAEGRINDSHLFAIQRSLDDTFDDDRTLHFISPSKTVTPDKQGRIPKDPTNVGSAMGSPKDKKVTDATDVGGALG